jgi:hypothetical protein
MISAIRQMTRCSDRFGVLIFTSRARRLLCRGAAFRAWQPTKATASTTVPGHRQGYRKEMKKLPRDTVMAAKRLSPRRQAFARR